MAFLLLSISLFDLHPAAAQTTQGESILDNPDIALSCQPDSLNIKGNANGCCGAPGRRLCSHLPSCTAPGNNDSRIDPYDGQIVCEQPTASCGQAFADFQAQAAAGTSSRDFTFYLTSDIHPWRESFRLPDQVRHVRIMNAFTGLGLKWPAGIGFDNIPFVDPWGLIVAGDLTESGAKEELGAYRLLYEQGTIADSTRFRVFHGLGNHDIDTGNAENTGRMVDYVRNTMSCGVTMDPVSHSYAWDWNGVHFVQLNFYATYTFGEIIGSAIPWLTQNLANTVGNSNRPVIVIQHTGCDTSFSLGGGTGCLDADPSPPPLDSKGKPVLPWWYLADRQALANALKPYNAIAFFSGHTHFGSVNRFYQLSDAYNNSVIRLDNFVNGMAGGNEDICGDESDCSPYPSHGEFYVVRVTNSYLDVVPVRWWDNGWEIVNGTGEASSFLTLDQRRDQSTELSRVAIDATVANFKFSQPGCRKRINDRFITVAPGNYALNSAGGTLVTVQNLTPRPIWGPLALRIRGSTPKISFVDSCVDEGSNSQSYVLFGLVLGQSLAPAGQSGASASVDAGVPFDPTKMDLVVLTPIQGYDQPITVDVAADGSISCPGSSCPSAATFYGPPNMQFGAAVTGDSGLGWLTVQPTIGTFDAYGHAVVSYSIHTDKLPSQSSGELGATIQLTTGQDDAQGYIYSMGVPFAIHFRTLTTLQLTASPAAFETPGGGTHVLFTATVGNVAHTDDVINDQILLYEVAADGSNPTLLSTGFLDFTPEEGEGDCNSYPNYEVVFGDTPASHSSHNYCPTETATGALGWGFNLAAGLHYLRAHFVGDGQYQASDSPIIPYRIGPAIGSLHVLSGGGQSTYTGVSFDNPITVQVVDAFSNPIPGVQVSVSFPASGPSATLGGTWAGVTGSDGEASSPRLSGNGLAGSYSGTAFVTEAGSTASAPFQLTNLTPTGQSPAITATVLSKAPFNFLMPNERQWTLNLRNIGGPAYGVQITSFQVAPVGVSCTPVVLSLLPAWVASLPTLGSTSTGTVFLNFNNCPSNAQYTVTVGISANAGAYTTQTVIGHQFQ